MKELSYHILDIVQNSISAGANLIDIVVNENIYEDKLVIIVNDNGKGMSESTIEKVKDPFFTSRDTRKVGLGVPLLYAATQRCQGDLYIDSNLGKGTKIVAVFKYSHIDRAPLGNIWDTMKVIIGCNEDVDFTYTHIYKDQSFNIDTREMKKILKEVPITSPDGLEWIGDYIKDGIKSINGGT